MEETTKMPDTENIVEKKIDKDEFDIDYKNKDLSIKEKQLKTSKNQLRTSMVGIGVMLGSFTIIFFQLCNTSKVLEKTEESSRVALRDQLYATEDVFGKEARDDDDLNFIWQQVPSNLADSNFSRKLLELLVSDKDPRFVNVKTASELYERIWGYETMSDSALREKTKLLRKLYLYAEGNFYNIHNAFDYKKKGVMENEDWINWKGTIRDMSAHPVFLAVIWSGHKYDYLAPDFASFLFNEICTENPDGLKTPEDLKDYYRDRNFIFKFFPEMKDSTKWVNKIPKS